MPRASAVALEFSRRLILAVVLSPSPAPCVTVCALSQVMVIVAPGADPRKTKEAIQACITSYAYLAKAGSTGPAKPSASSSAGASAPKSGATPSPGGGAASAGPGGSGGGGGGGGGGGVQQSQSTAYGSAMKNLLRRTGTLWLTPAELMSGCGLP